MCRSAPGTGLYVLMSAFRLKLKCYIPGLLVFHSNKLSSGSNMSLQKCRLYCDNLSSVVFDQLPRESPTSLHLILHVKQTEPERQRERRDGKIPFNTVLFGH